MIWPQVFGLFTVLVIVMLGCTMSTNKPEATGVVITSPDPEQVTRDVEAIINGMNRAQSRSEARQ